MSRLYASVEADASKTPATRRGHRNIEAHVRGWESGVRVVARGVKDGPDVFEVFATHGSNGSGSDVAVARIVDGRIELLPGAWGDR